MDEYRIGEFVSQICSLARLGTSVVVKHNSLLPRAVWIVRKLTAVSFQQV